MVSGTANPVVQRPQRTSRGVILIVCAVALMALQDALVKWASADLPLSQIFVLRSLLVLPVLTALAGRGALSAWRSGLSAWPISRALCLSLMYLSLYAALPFLPLSTLAAGFYTGPLFIVLLAARFLDERAGRWGWLAVGIGFLGVLVLLRPGADVFEPAALLPVLSGLFYAIAAIITRGKCQDERAASLALALNVVLLATGILIAIPGMAGQGIESAGAIRPFLFRPWLPLETDGFLLIAVLAVLMVGIGLGLAAAYQLAAPVVVASFDYSYLVFAALLGFVMFGEIPDMTTLAGTALILSAGFIVILKGAGGQE